jgi:hypothetical protein
MENGMRRLILAVFILIGGGSALSAAPKKPATPKITSVFVTKGDQTVTVAFTTSVKGVPGIATVDQWNIVVFFANKAPTVKPPKVVAPSEVKPSPFQANAVFVTLPEAALADDVQSIVVSFGGSQSPPASAPPKASNSHFMNPKSQNDADNSLTGSYSPAIHSQAQYTISGQGNLAFGPFAKRLYFGATASVATDKRPSADPDSFFVSPLIQCLLKSKRFWNNRAGGLLANWDVAGLEFDRSTTTKTLVSSARVEVPFLVYPAPGKSLGVFSASLYPYIGATAGTNFSNALEPGGSGGVFRGDIGGSIGVVFDQPSVSWMQKISLAGTDTLRIPATSEIYTYTHYISQTGKTVNIPVLSTHLRNHVTGELDFTVAKPFSLSVKYENGVLPPAFKAVNNKVTIGIKIALQQRNGANTKISVNAEAQ